MVGIHTVATRGCILSHFHHHAHYQQGAQKKSIHATEPGRKSSQQREMCYGLSKQDSVGKKKAQINNTVVWEVEESYQALGGEWGSN